MATATTTKKKLVYKQDPDGVFRIKKEANSSPSAGNKSSNNSSADKSVQDYLDQLINLTYTIVEEPLPPTTTKTSAPTVAPSTKSTSAGTKLGTKPKPRKNSSISRANFSDADSIQSDNSTFTLKRHSVSEPQIIAYSDNIDVNPTGTHQILSPIPKVATQNATTVNTNLAGGVALSTTASPIKESPSANLPTTILDLPTTKSFYIPFLSLSMSAPMENLRFHWPSFIGGCAIALVLQQMSPLLLDQAVTMMNILKNLGIVSAVLGVILWYLGLIRAQDVQSMKWVLLNMRQRFWAGREGDLVALSPEVEKVEVYDVPETGNAEAVVRRMGVRDSSPVRSSRMGVRDSSPVRVPAAPIAQPITQGLQPQQYRPRNVIRPVRAGLPTTGEPFGEYNSLPKPVPKQTGGGHLQMQPESVRYKLYKPSIASRRAAHLPLVNPEQQHNMHNSRTLSHDALEKLAKQGYKGIQRNQLDDVLPFVQRNPQDDVLPFVNRIRLEDEDPVGLEDDVQRPLPPVPGPMPPRRRISQESMQSLGIGRLNTTLSTRSVLGTRKNYGEFVAAADAK